MKYKCYSVVANTLTSNTVSINPKKGGDYWRNSDFQEHLKLTSFQTTYQFLLKNYPPPMKILEAGCGIGRWIIPLAKNNYDVTGIEIEKEAIEIIGNNYISEKLTLVNGDIFNMPFSNNSFDFILSLGVLEHFEDPKIQQKAINEHIRVLKDDGALLITVPFLSIFRFFFHIPYVKYISFLRKTFFDIPYVKYISFLRKTKRKKEEYFTEYRYSKSEFKRVLEKCNLEIINIVYDDLAEPYNFGLTVDRPFKKYFRSADCIDFKANKKGQKIFNLLWKIHPKLVSGGIGFVCKKYLNCRV